MSAVDSIFLAVNETPEEVAGWLTEVHGVERREDQAAGGEAVGLRGRVGDDWLGVVVQRNGYVLVDPEPGELQAIDGYGIDVGIRYRSEDVLHRESRLMFGRLVEAHPETAMLLLHDLDILVAAYLPGAGVHDFVPGTTQDAPDADHWRPWVVA